MRLYLDTEFSSFDCKVGDLISVAFLTDHNDLFYAEFSDVNWDNASGWVLRNVKPLLKQPHLPKNIKLTYEYGTAAHNRWTFIKWIKSIEHREKTDVFTAPPIIEKAALSKSHSIHTYSRKLQTEFNRRLNSYRNSKLKFELWTEVGDFDWVYLANWLAEDYKGNLTDFSNAVGIDFPYHHFDISQFCDPTKSNTLFEKKASSEEKSKLRTIIGTSNAHAAWADAFKLRAMVNLFEKNNSRK